MTSEIVQPDAGGPHGKREGDSPAQTVEERFAHPLPPDRRRQAPEQPACGHDPGPVTRGSPPGRGARRIAAIVETTAAGEIPLFAAEASTMSFIETTPRSAPDLSTTGRRRTLEAFICASALSTVSSVWHV